MEITLELGKSIEENASMYFDKAKKFKKKKEGAKITLENARKKLLELEKKQAVVEDKVVEPKVIRKKEWYEKFRWFISSEGFLCIGGRDATTNDIIVKKHADKEDVIFHTDMAGSPFFIIKTDGRTPGDATFNEVADATLTFSRAWKLGLGTAEVFHVKPEQVTKDAQSGEYLKKGSFMIKGKTNYIDNKINLAIGAYEDKIMAGPKEAIEANCKEFLVIEPGTEKASAVAKKIKSKIGGELDDIIRVLPSGNYNIPKN